MGGGSATVAGGSATAAMVTGHGTTLEPLGWAAPQDRAVMRPRPCDVGPVHLALQVDDIEAMVETCAGDGWAPRGSIETWPEGEHAGTRLACLVDGDGTTLKVSGTAERVTGT